MEAELELRTEEMCSLTVGFMNLRLRRAPPPGAILTVWTLNRKDMLMYGILMYTPEFAFPDGGSVTRSKMLR